MKKVKLMVAALGFATAGLFAFKAVEKSSIKGSISPADGAVRAWALSATDTFRSAVSNGAFEITNVKAGNYRVIIEAKAPYKNAAKESVAVTDGQSVDIGEIKLDSAKTMIH